jgi:glucan biosynthesis protein C
MALTILVVIHHLVMNVLLAGNTSPGPVETIGQIFVAFNQAYFMGLFFLLSAYFVPAAYENKGSARFLYDRFVRLFIPLFIYTFVLSQVTAIGTYVIDRVPFTWNSYLSNVTMGHLWFVELLLVFVCLYAVWARFTNRNQDTSAYNKNTPPTYSAIIVFILALAVALFVMRIWFPILVGASGGSPQVIAIVGFFTVSGYDLPQYIGLFIVGIIAYRRNWFSNIPYSMGWVGLGMIIGSTLTLYPLAAIGGIDGLTFLGGWTWPSFVYCLWESVYCVGMCLGLITLFRKCFNRSGKFSNFMSTHAFVVYIIHIPVISCVVIALNGLHGPNTFKLLVAVLITLPLCFMLGYLIRKIPKVSRTI